MIYGKRVEETITGRRICMDYTKGIFICTILAISLTFPLFGDDPPRVFTWEDCVREALVKNPNLVSAREKMNQSDAAVGITRAPMLPQISATAGATRDKTDVSGGTANTAASYSYGLTGKQLVFDGLKSVYDLKAAKSQADLARKDYELSMADTRLNLRSAFIELLRTQEALVITREIETRRKHDLDLVRIRYEGGNEHRGSLFSATADHEQAKADLSSAQRSVSLAKRKLCAAMGIPESDSIEAKGGLTLSTAYDTHPDFAQLAAKHPSVVRAALQIETAGYESSSAKMSYSPQIYGVASAQRTRTSSHSTTNLSVGVELTAPLFEGGMTMYTVSKAESAYRQAESDSLGVKYAVTGALEEKWNTLADAIDHVKVSKAYLDAANERSKIGEAQYSIGTISFDNWTILETNLVSAKKSYLESCAAMLVAEAQWIQSIGGGLEDETKR
jgi:outer membrane protein TolC